MYSFIKILVQILLICTLSINVSEENWLCFYKRANLQKRKERKMSLGKAGEFIHCHDNANRVKMALCLET